MTEQEIERCLERFTIGKATDVMNFDYAGTLAYIQRLKSENAALRERLEKAVELPFVPTDYHIEGWLAEMKQSVTDESVTIVVPIYAYLKCDNREAAEARLAELNRRINIEVKKLD